SIALSLAPDHADLQSQTGVEPSELRETDGHGQLKGRARGFFPSPAYGSDRNASAHRGNESRELKVQNSKPENLLLPTFLTQIPQNVFTQPRDWLGQRLSICNFLHFAPIGGFDIKWPRSPLLTKPN